MYETDNQILFIKRGKMSEKEKMLAGKIYDPTDKELTILRTKAHRLSQHYNTLF